MSVWVVYTVDQTVGVFTTRKRALAAMIHVERNTSVAVHMSECQLNKVEGDDDPQDPE